MGAIKILSIQNQIKFMKEQREFEMHASSSLLWCLRIVVSLLMFAFVPLQEHIAILQMQHYYKLPLRR